MIDYRWWQDKLSATITHYIVNRLTVLIITIGGSPCVDPHPSVKEEDGGLRRRLDNSWKGKVTISDQLLLVSLVSLVSGAHSSPHHQTAFLLFDMYLKMHVTVLHVDLF